MNEVTIKTDISRQATIEEYRFMYVSQTVETNNLSQWTSRVLEQGESVNLFSLGERTFFRIYVLSGRVTISLFDEKGGADVLLSAPGEFVISGTALTAGDRNSVSIEGVDETSTVTYILGD